MLWYSSSVSGFSRKIVVICNIGNVTSTKLASLPRCHSHRANGCLAVKNRDSEMKTGCCTVSIGRRSHHLEWVISQTRLLQTACQGGPSLIRLLCVFHRAEERAMFRDVRKSRSELNNYDCTGRSRCVACFIRYTFA